MKRLSGCKTDRSINFLSIISLSTILVERTINKNCAYCIGGGGLCNDYVVHNSNIQQSRFESYKRGAELP